MYVCVYCVCRVTPMQKFGAGVVWKARGAHILSFTSLVRPPLWELGTFANTVSARYACIKQSVYTLSGMAYLDQVSARRAHEWAGV